MPPAREKRFMTDSQRDAARYHRLLLGLDHATGEIRTLERAGHPGIDQVLERLLPDLADALNAAQAFVAVLRQEGGSQWFELTAVHPRRELRGQRLPCMGLLQQIANDGKPQVVDSPEGQASLVPGLEVLEATCAVVVELRTATQLRMIGVCNKARPELGPFLAADRMALDYTVELVAIGARAGERRSRELEQIQATSAAISSEFDLSQLLPLIVHRTAEVFDAPAVSLMLWDEAEESLVINAQWGLSEAYVRDQRIPRATVQDILASLGNIRPLAMENLRVSPFGRPDLIEAERLCSVLAAPLLVSGKLIGVLNTYSKDAPRHFDPDEIDLAEILANQAAIAIQNARLRQRELESLQMTSAAIGSTLDLAVLLPLITLKASQVFEAPATSLMLWNEAKEELVIRAGHGLSDDYTRRQRIPRARVDARAFQAGAFRPVVTLDARLDGLGSSELYRRERICTVLSVPLVVSSELVGVLNIYSKEKPRRFTPDKIELATIFANQAAVAIENARLYSTLQETSQHLNSLVASSFDAVIAIDQDNQITVFNQQAEKILGYAEEEMLGRSVARLHSDFEQARIIHDRVRQDGAISDYEVVLKDKQGQLIPVSLSAVSIKDAKGNEIEQAGFMRDLRHIRSLQDRLRALVRVSQKLSGALDLQQVYDLIVQSAVSALQEAQKGALHLYDASAGLLKIKASHDYSPEVADMVVLRVGEGRAGWVYERAQLLNVGNVQEHKQSKRFGYAGEDEIKSSLCVPIILEHQTIGTLSVDSISRYNAFGPDDEEILTALANQAAIAIGNARQYGKARRRMEELDRLRTVGQAIAQRVIEKPKEVFDQIARGACQVIGADSAVIYPYLADKGAFDVFSIGLHGLQVGKKLDAVKPRGELTSMTGVVLQEGLVIVDDVAAGHDRSGQVPIHKGRFLEQERVASFVGVALVAEAEQVGVLFVNFKSVHPFADDELSLISILANQAAVAIKQVQLFEQVNQELERRTKEQAATHAVAKLLGSVLHLETVWREILDGALRITGAKRGLILLWDKSRNRLGLQVSQGITNRERRHLKERLALADGMTEWITRNRQTVMVPDLFRHPAADWYIPTNPNMRAVLIAPIFQEGFLIGVIGLESPQVAAFSQEDVRLMENLASYAGFAVNNGMQYAEIEQNALLREGLLKAGHGITALKEPQEVLQAIADSVRAALACDVVTLYAYDQAKEEIGLPVVSGELRRRGQFLERWNVRQESVVGKLVALGRPHYADDSLDDSTMTAGSFARREGIRSSAGIPLRVGDETLGILFVNYRERHHFATQEQAEVELFATQAAIAINNARLYKDLERQSQHRAALYEASKAITAGFSVERRRVLDSIVKQTVERITGIDSPKATWGAIQLVDQEKNELVFESVYAPRMPSLRNRLGERRSLDKTQAPDGRIGITGRAVLTRMQQRVDDVRFDPDYVEFDPTTRSELDVPLLDGDKVVGVLGVEVDQPEAFDVEDERALQGLAELAVIAIKNAEQAERLSRTNAFAVMGAWGAEIVHQVNDEVGTIRLAVNLAQRRMDSPERVAQYLGEIDACAERLGLPALPERAPKPGEVIEFRDAPLLDEIVKEVIGTIRQELASQARVSIETDLQCDGIRVAMHLYWLSRLIQHLVRNAARVIVPDGKDNRVTVRTIVRNTVAEVSVQDTGPGIPSDKVSLLFNQPVPHGDETQGRALLVVSYIASVYGGSARLVSNRVGEGACFAFSVPLARPLT